VMLYELLCGQPPFKGTTSFETIQKVVTEEPGPPSRVRPGVPRDLETICLKCLQKDPLKRYAGAEDLAGDLRRWQNGEPILARPAGRVERTVKWARRYPARAALVVVIFFNDPVES
jgi:eukaryotic-like serine/threonine-protein kinase